MHARPRRAELPRTRSTGTSCSTPRAGSTPIAGRSRPPPRTARSTGRRAGEVPPAGRQPPQQAAAAAAAPKAPWRALVSTLAQAGGRRRPVLRRCARRTTTARLVLDAGYGLRRPKSRGSRHVPDTVLHRVDRQAVHRRRDRPASRAGRLSFDAPVGEYVSGLPARIARHMTIGELLDMTAGLGERAQPGQPAPNAGRDGRADRQEHPQFEPGTNPPTATTAISCSAPWSSS